ncbi:hypothetical protein MRX96_020819 [Rhipicephalus microplus]
MRQLILQALVEGCQEYVTEDLIVLGKVPCERVQGVVKGVLEVFKRHSSGLKFTQKMPVENKIQFLDLRLRFAKEHICFKYNPRLTKGLLSFESAHLKLVKRGIVLPSCAAALDKSCPYLIFESFENQVARLGAAVYPAQILVGARESLFNKYNGEGPSVVRKERRPIYVMLY